MAERSIQRPDVPQHRGRPACGVPGRAVQALSVILALVTVAASVPTVVVPGVLNGPPAMNGSARGTALGMLVLGVPLLIGSLLALRRGVNRALPLWLGALAYLLYNAFMLLFGTPFNSLFLLYVATFSLALWSLVAILSQVDVGAVGNRVRAGVPRRAIAVFVWIVVALNTAAWLRVILPDLQDGDHPALLDGTGLTTVPTYVQDLAFWLPLMGVAACWLWRGRAWGYLVASAGLVMWVIEALTIAADQLLGSRADPTSVVVSAAMSPTFVMVALLTAVPTVVMLRHL